MKKVFLAIAIVAVLGCFSSCSKTKTCHCKAAGTSVWGPTFEISEGSCSDKNTTIGGVVVTECERV